MFINYGPAVLILFSIFFGIFMNRRDYSLLREDMNRRFDELKADLKADLNFRFGEVDRRLALIEADQKQFFKETGEIHGRLNELSRS